MTHWFNLKTWRGWTLTAGVLVIGASSLGGTYWLIQADDQQTRNSEAARLGSPEAAALQSGRAQEPDTNPHGVGVVNHGPAPAQTDQSVGPQPILVQVSYSIEQHKQRLEAREQELRDAIQASPQGPYERRGENHRELQAVQGQLQDLHVSYQDALAGISHLVGELGALRGHIPETHLQEALDVLGHGATKLADTLLAEVDNRAQQTIELMARAASGRGRIAYYDVRWREALTHFEKADLLVPGHEEYRHWAARLPHALGDFDTAARRYEAIRDSVRTRSGEDARELRDPSNSLAFVYQDQGRYADAEPLFKTALSISEKVLPPDDPDLVTGYGNLAAAHQAQGRFNEAEPLLKKALFIAQKVLPEDHPALATAYNNLASLYRVQNRLSEAEPLFKQALALSETALPADHPTLAARYNGLGLIYWSQDRFTEAEPLFRKAVAVGEKSLPADHQNLATWYNNLALVYRDQGRYSEAEPLFKKAIVISERALPAGHPTLATWYHNLALTYHAQDRFDEAGPLYRRSLEVLESKLGASHWKTSLVAKHYAELQKKQGRLDEADALLKRSAGQ
jgi:tetratricopeptide (TPR) repeat protein